jgi:hypothetical protein
MLRRQGFGPQQTQNYEVSNTTESTQRGTRALSVRGAALQQSTRRPLRLQNSNSEAVQAIRKAIPGGSTRLSRNGKEVVTSIAVAVNAELSTQLHAHQLDVSAPAVQNDNALSNGTSVDKLPCPPDKTGSASHGLLLPLVIPAHTTRRGIVHAGVRKGHLSLTIAAHMRETRQSVSQQIDGSSQQLRATELLQVSGSKPNGYARSKSFYA